MTRPLNTRKSWQSNNAGCTSKISMDRCLTFSNWCTFFCYRSAFYNPVVENSCWHSFKNKFHCSGFNSAFWWMDRWLLTSVHEREPSDIQLMLSIVLCSTVSRTLTNEHEGGGILQQQSRSDLNWSGNHCFVRARPLDMAVVLCWEG